MREQHDAHTGLLRLGLAVEPSLEFWRRAGTKDEGLVALAQEQDWFPGLSAARVKYLVGQLERRFPAESRVRLSQWNEAAENAPILCHWHLQLADPTYRDFTFTSLVPRWSTGDDELSLDQVERWLSRREGSQHWQEATRRLLASGLFSAATEAGLLTGVTPSTRLTRRPKVPVEAIAYLLGLLDSLEVVDSTPYLLTAGWGELELAKAREEGILG